MTLRQRQPREEDPAYLTYVRTLPCLVCQRPGPNDPAHLRSAAPQYGKRLTGMAEKPDDKWVLPLCRTHHDDQHRHNELQWWARKGIPDPFAVAAVLYAGRPNQSRPRPAPRKAMKRRTAKRATPSRDLESRSTFPPKGSRKIPSRAKERAST